MLFDFVTLKLIWWVLIGLVLILYATTAGFDFGVTLMLPFTRRHQDFESNDRERRVMLNTIAPTWDGNQTWLVFAGGALFVIWPVVYAATFSGMYALMLLILWAFFLRPPGFDYRGKLPSPQWRKFWDFALFVSALLPVFAFGLAIGNLFVGLPISFDPIMMRSFYNGNFGDLLNLFGVVCALAALLMCLMQGAAHLNRRTSGDLQQHFRHLQRLFGVTLLLVLTLAGVLLATQVQGYHLVSESITPDRLPFQQEVTRIPGGWFLGMMAHPWKWIPVAIAYLGIVLSLGFAGVGRGGLSFWCSSLGVSGIVAMFGSTLFPFVIPSSSSFQDSLTIWNATSADYTLNAMLWVGAVVLLIIFIYKFLGYHALWRQKGHLTTQDVEENNHTFY